MNAPRQSAIESAILKGAVSALRQRAAAIRASAVRDGVTVVEVPFTIIRTSEAACALKIAASLDCLADDLAADLEAEGRR